MVAAQTPSHSFTAALEAARLAVTYRTPVILLSDGYLANGAEPWRLPDVATLPTIDPDFATAPNHVADDGAPEFWPYLRDPDTLARAWATPGTPGLAHRIGGIEKEDGSGNISYDPANHERMVQLRAAKIAGFARSLAPVEIEGDPDADLMVLGWGSTWGSISAAVGRVRKAGHKVAWVHLTHLNPFPPGLGEALAGRTTIVVPEMNLGQLSKMVRAEFLVDAQSITKVQGQPFTAGEIEAELLTRLGATAPETEQTESVTRMEVPRG